MKRLAIFIVVLAGLGSAMQARDAAASAFMVRENSAASVATAYAGNASRADDVSTVFNNPAGMSWLDDNQIEVGATGVFPSIHFQGSVVAGGSTTLPGDNSHNGGQFALVPHIYGVYHLDDKITLGIAVTAPFGNTVDYPETWSGRYVDIKTAALTMDINPNISYRLSDRISIAAGVSYQYLRVQLLSSLPQSLIVSGQPDVYYMLRAEDWAWGYNFGVLAEPWDGTRIGLTYRSAVNHTIMGTLSFTPNVFSYVTSPASAPFNLPASIGGSITQQVTQDLSLSSDVQLTQWSTFQKVAVTSANPTFTFLQGYRDSWMISVGGTYRLTDDWTLRGGLGWDETPVTDQFRLTGVPDQTRYMVGAGFGYRIGGASSVDMGYAHYFASGPASMNSSVNNTDPTSVTTLHGQYNNALDYLTISFRTTL